MKLSISGLEYPQFTFEQIVVKAKDFGINYLEIGIRENLKKGNISINQLQKTLDKHNMKLSALNVASPDLIDQGISLASKLGAQYLIVREDGIETLNTKRIALEKYRKMMLQYITRAEKSDIIMVLENGPTGITKSPEGLLGLVELVESPYLQINYDPDNFYNAGYEPFPYAYELLKDHIAFVHVKDSAYYDKVIYGENVRVLHRADKNVICVTPGSGAINWEGIIKCLKTTQFNGFLSIEPHVSPQKMDKIFLDTIDYLRKYGSVALNRTKN